MNCLKISAVDQIVALNWHFNCNIIHLVLKNLVLPRRSGIFNGPGFVTIMNESTENQTQIILDSVADGVFTVDLDWKITSFNKAAERITGITKAEAVGRYCWEVFKASICEQQCSLRQTIESGNPIVNQSIFTFSPYLC
jgi:PAS domain-containing protein